MGELTDRIVALATQPSSEDALAVLRLSVVDWMACGIAGSAEPVSEVLARMLDEEGGHGQASTFGGAKRPARAAALYNGTASHALDYDDTHFAHIGHLSVGVLPAAVAMAERVGASVGDMLRAGLAGCEGATRMGIALGRDHYQMGYHQTATAGAFGATLAATLLDSGDPQVRSHALGLASTRASGLKSQFGTMGKPLNAGLAASNGIEAALLAGRGMVSNPDGWDGPLGAIKAQHGEGAEIGPDGFLFPRISHKFHACCHGLHAMLEALASLPRPELGDLHSMTVYTHPRWLTVCNQPAPRTGLELKFSFAGAAALALNGYATGRMDTFSDRLASDPAILKVRDMVNVVADDTLSEMQSRVVLNDQIADYDLSVDLPLSVRTEKIKRKAADLIGDQRAQAIWDVVHGDDNQSIRHLADLM